MIRILITGSRDWPLTDITTVYTVMSKTITDYVLQGETQKTITIVHGACPKGVDAMADLFARSWGMNIERHPANWDLYGKKAGPIRNKEMVELGVDICLAFVYNKSSGASHAVELCRKKGVPLILLER